MAVAAQTTAARVEVSAPVSRSAPGLGRRLLRNRRAVVGGLIVLVFCLVAIGAPLVAPYAPEAQTLAQRNRPPSLDHLMGTDALGRDILSRAIWASRVSLSIGIVSVLLSALLSTTIGAVAGYAGGWVDNVLMRLTDAFLAFPTLFLMIAIVAAFGSHLPVLIAVLGVTAWQTGARVVRGEVLSLRSREFVQAARGLGASDARVLVRHILPNLVAVVIVSATIRVALNILLEVGLSYLGLGVQSPLASWGNMVAEGKSVLRAAWWVSAFPGVFIVLTVMAFNLLGDGLRDVTDPRRRIA
jgi:peptide/nickel transport system permease protein